MRLLGKSLVIMAAMVLIGCKSGGMSDGVHDAAEAGDLAGVQAALAEGKSVDEKEGGEPALYIAVENGHTEIIKLLVDKGADVNARDADMETPLHPAAYKGRYEVCKLLIDKGAKVNVADEDGETPLHYAAKRGHPQVVELLIASGADLKAKDADGDTPLAAAERNGATDAATIIRAKGGTR